MAESTGALIVRVAGHLRFVPASLAGRIVYRAAISPVPGTPIGMALVSGQVVSVIELGPPAGQLLVCDVDGEAVAFAGIEAVAAGYFATADGHAEFEGLRVPELDVKGELRRVEQHLWLRKRQEGDDV